MTIEFKLETALTLCEHLGNPQDSIPYYIHVGGICGKTSTVCQLHRLLESCAPELRVGSLIHPYLRCPRDSIRIGSSMLEETTFNELLRHVNKMDEIFGTKCTFYERLVMVAFLSFKEAHCDLIIVESAMGGTFDATNVLGRMESSCRPLAILLTSIGLDHTRFLGEDLSCVTANLLGLLRPQAPLVIAKNQLEPVLRTMQKFNVEMAPSVAPFGELDVDEFITQFPLHQQRTNVDLALRAFQLIVPKLQSLLRTKIHRPPLGVFTDLALPQAFSQLYYRGKNLFVDSSQNGLSVFNDWVRGLPPSPAGQYIHLVLGIKRKQGPVHEQFFQRLGCRPDYRFSFVRFTSNPEYPSIEVAPREVLIEHVNDAYAEEGASTPPVVTDHAELLEVLSSDLSKDHMVLVFGSPQIVSNFYRLCAT